MPLTYTIQEFAQRYRAAHPGKYGNFTDDELVKHYLSYNPSYQNNIRDLDRLFPTTIGAEEQAPMRAGVAYDEGAVAGFGERMEFGFKSMFYNLGPGLGGTVLSVTDAPWAVSKVEGWRKWARDKNLELVRNNPEIQGYLAWKRDEPVTLDNFWHMDIAMRGLSEMLPSFITMFTVGTATAAATGGWGLPAVIASMGTMGALEGSGEYIEAMNIMVDEKGMRPEDANQYAGLAAATYGVISGVIEYGPLKLLLGKSALAKAAERRLLGKVTEKLVAKGLTGKAIARGTTATYRSFVQGMTEGTQEWAQAETQHIINYGLEHSLGATPEEAFANIGKAFKTSFDTETGVIEESYAGFVGGIFLGGAGGLVAGAPTIEDVEGAPTAPGVEKEPVIGVEREPVEGVPPPIEVAPPAKEKSLSLIPIRKVPKDIQDKINKISSEVQGLRGKDGTVPKNKSTEFREGQKKISDLKKMFGETETSAELTARLKSFTKDDLKKAIDEMTFVAQAQAETILNIVQRLAGDKGYRAIRKIMHEGGVFEGKNVLGLRPKLQRAIANLDIKTGELSKKVVVPLTGDIITNYLTRLSDPSREQIKMEVPPEGKTTQGIVGRIIFEDQNKPVSEKAISLIERLGEPALDKIGKLEDSDRLRLLLGIKGTIEKENPGANLGEGDKILDSLRTIYVKAKGKTVEEAEQVSLADEIVTRHVTFDEKKLTRSTAKELASLGMIEAVDIEKAMAKEAEKVAEPKIDVEKEVVRAVEKVPEISAEEVEKQAIKAAEEKAVEAAVPTPEQVEKAVMEEAEKQAPVQAEEELLKKRITFKTGGYALLDGKKIELTKGEKASLKGIMKGKGIKAFQTKAAMDLRRKILKRLEAPPIEEAPAEVGDQFSGLQGMDNQELTKHVKSLGFNIIEKTDLEGRKPTTWSILPSKVEGWQDITKAELNLTREQLIAKIEKREAPAEDTDSAGEAVGKTVTFFSQTTEGVSWSDRKKGKTKTVKETGMIIAVTGKDVDGKDIYTIKTESTTFEGVGADRVAFTDESDEIVKSRVKPKKDAAAPPTKTGEDLVGTIVSYKGREYHVRRINEAGFAMLFDMETKKNFPGTPRPNKLTYLREGTPLDMLKIVRKEPPVEPGPVVEAPPVPKADFDIHGARREPLKYTSKQHAALAMIQSQVIDGDEKMFVMAGYAGTGKTTIVENIAMYATVKKKSVHMVALTNTAVQRLREKNGKGIGEYATIHKLLYGSPDPETGEWIPKTMFGKNSIVVVDEASMVNKELLSDLRSEVIAKGGSIIFIGDSFQLKPIGDDPAILLNPNIELTEVTRQGLKSNILKYATALRTSKRVFIPKESKGDVKVTNNATDGFLSDVKADKDVVFVVATNPSRNALNKRARATKYGDKSENPINDNESLIGIANGPHKNGESFVIKKAPKDVVYQEVKIEVRNRKTGAISLQSLDSYVFDNEGIQTLLIPATRLPSVYHGQIVAPDGIGLEVDDRGNLSKSVDIVTYGYAITAHKSQGNEWTKVFVKQDYFKDDSRWLYTAVTRAQKELVIQRFNQKPAEWSDIETVAEKSAVRLAKLVAEQEAPAEKVTPENITKLEPNQIFVFGSNLAGRHGKGAALTAKQKFGAIQGQGEGLQGQTYALPTKDKNIKTLSLDDISKNIDTFIEVAKNNPDKEFLLTKIGTGLGAISMNDMANLIKSKIFPNNIVLPKEFISKEAEESFLEKNEEIFKKPISPDEKVDLRGVHISNEKFNVLRPQRRAMEEDAGFLGSRAVYLWAKAGVSWATNKFRYFVSLKDAKVLDIRWFGEKASELEKALPIWSEYNISSDPTKYAMGGEPMPIGMVETLFSKNRKLGKYIVHARPFNASNRVIHPLSNGILLGTGNTEAEAWTDAEKNHPIKDKKFDVDRFLEQNKMDRMVWDYHNQKKQAGERTTANLAFLARGKVAYNAETAEFLDKFAAQYEFDAIYADEMGIDKDPQIAVTPKGQKKLSIDNVIEKQVPAVPAPAEDTPVHAGKGLNVVLSNFHENVFSFRGQEFRTAEGAYQAWKSGKYVDGFQNLTGVGAKALGRGKKVDTDNNLNLMREILRAKYEQVPEFTDALNKAGKITHPVKDKFWAENFPKLLEELKEAPVKPAVAPEMSGEFEVIVANNLVNNKGKSIPAGVVEGKIAINEDLLRFNSAEEVLDSQDEETLTAMIKSGDYAAIINTSKDDKDFLRNFLIAHERGHLELGDEASESMVNERALKILGVKKKARKNYTLYKNDLEGGVEQAWIGFSNILENAAKTGGTIGLTRDAFNSLFQWALKQKTIGSKIMVKEMKQSFSGAGYFTYSALSDAHLFGKFITQPMIEVAKFKLKPQFSEYKAEDFFRDASVYYDKAAPAPAEAEKPIKAKPVKPSKKKRDEKSPTKKAQKKGGWGFAVEGIPQMEMQETAKVYRDVITRLRKKMPFVKNIIVPEMIITPEGRKAWGAALGTMTKFVEGGGVGVPPHEYFHVYYQMMKNSTSVRLAEKKFRKEAAAFGREFDVPGTVEEYLSYQVSQYYVERVQAPLKKKIEIWLKSFWLQAKKIFARNKLSQAQVMSIVFGEFYKGREFTEAQIRAQAEKNVEGYSVDIATDDYMDDMGDVDIEASEAGSSAADIHIISYFSRIWNVHITDKQHMQMSELARGSDNYKEFESLVTGWAENEYKKTVKYDRKQRNLLKQFFHKQNARIRTYDAENPDSPNNADSRVYFNLIYDPNKPGGFELVPAKEDLLRRRILPKWKIQNFVEKDGVIHRTFHLPLKHIVKLVPNPKYNEKEAKRLGEAYTEVKEFIFAANQNVDASTIRMLESRMAQDYDEGSPDLLFFTATKGGDNSQMFFSGVPKKFLNMNEDDFITYLDGEMQESGPYKRANMAKAHRDQLLKDAQKGAEDNPHAYSQAVGRHEWWKGVYHNKYMINAKNIQELFNRLKLAFAEGFTFKGMGGSKIMIMDHENVTLEVDGKEVALLDKNGRYVNDGWMMTSGEHMRKIERYIGRTPGRDGHHLGELKTAIWHRSEDGEDFLAVKAHEMVPFNGMKFYFMEGGKKRLLAEVRETRGLTYFVDGRGKEFDRMVSGEEAKMEAGMFSKDLDGYNMVHDIPEDAVRALIVPPSMSKSSSAFPIAFGELSIDPAFKNDKIVQNAISKIKQHYSDVADTYLDVLYQMRNDPKLLRDTVYREPESGEIPTELQEYLELLQDGVGLHHPHIMNMISSTLNNRLIIDGVFKARQQRGLGTFLALKPKVSLNVKKDSAIVSADNSVIFNYVQKKYFEEWMKPAAVRTDTAIVELMREWQDSTLEYKIESLNEWLKNNEIWGLFSRQPVTKWTGVRMRRIQELVRGHGDTVFFSTEDVFDVLDGDFDGDHVAMEFFENKEVEQAFLDLMKSEIFQGSDKIAYLDIFEKNIQNKSISNYNHVLQTISNQAKVQNSQGIITNSKSIAMIMADKDIKVALEKVKGYFEPVQPSDMVTMTYAPLDKEAVKLVYDDLIAQGDKIVNWKGEEVTLKNIDENKKIFLRTNHSHEMATLLKMSVDDSQYGLLAKIGYNGLNFITKRTWRYSQGPVSDKSNILHPLKAVRQFFNYSPQRRGRVDYNRTSTLESNIVKSKELHQFLESDNKADQIAEAVNNQKKKGDPNYKWWYRGANIARVSINDNVAPVEHLLRRLGQRDIKFFEGADELTLMERGGSPLTWSKGDDASNPYLLAHVNTMEKLQNEYDIPKKDMQAGVAFMVKVADEFYSLYEKAVGGIEGIVTLKFDYSKDFSEFIDKHIGEFNKLSGDAQVASTLYFLTVKKRVQALLPLKLMHKPTAKRYLNVWWDMLSAPSTSKFKLPRKLYRTKYPKFGFARVMKKVKEDMEKICG